MTSNPEDLYPEDLYPEDLKFSTPPQLPEIPPEPRRETEMDCNDIRARLMFRVFDVLDPGMESDGVHQHLERCPSCQRDESALRAIVGELNDDARPGGPESAMAEELQRHAAWQSLSRQLQGENSEIESGQGLDRGSETQELARRNDNTFDSAVLRQLDRSSELRRADLEASDSTDDSSTAADSPPRNTIAINITGALRCTYCHAGLLRSESTFCASCLAPHHSDCFLGHGQCAAPGCGETYSVRPQVPSARKNKTPKTDHPRQPRPSLAATAPRMPRLLNNPSDASHSNHFIQDIQDSQAFALFTQPLTKGALRLGIGITLGVGAPLFFIAASSSSVELQTLKSGLWWPAITPYDNAQSLGIKALLLTITSVLAFTLARFPALSVQRAAGTSDSLAGSTTLLAESTGLASAAAINVRRLLYSAAIALFAFGLGIAAGPQLPRLQSNATLDPTGDQDSKPRSEQSPALPKLDIHSELARAESLRGKRPVDEVLEIYDKLLADNPNQSLVLMARARLRLDAGYTFGAEKDAQTVLSLTSTARAFCLRAQIALARGQLDLASRNYLNALAMESQSAEALLGLARCSELNWNDLAALRNYEEVQQMADVSTTEKAQALTGIARIFAAQDLLQRAPRSALTDDPKPAAALMNRCRAALATIPRSDSQSLDALRLLARSALLCRDETEFLKAQRRLESYAQQSWVQRHDIQLEAILLGALDRCISSSDKTIDEDIQRKLDATCESLERAASNRDSAWGLTTPASELRQDPIPDLSLARYISALLKRAHQQTGQDQSQQGPSSATPIDASRLAKLLQSVEDDLDSPPVLTLYGEKIHAQRLNELQKNSQLFGFNTDPDLVRSGFARLRLALPLHPIVSLNWIRFEWAELQKKLNQPAASTPTPKQPLSPEDSRIITILRSLIPMHDAILPLDPELACLHGRLLLLQPAQPERARAYFEKALSVLKSIPQRDHSPRWGSLEFEALVALANLASQSGDLALEAKLEARAEEVLTTNLKNENDLSLYASYLEFWRNQNDISQSSPLSRIGARRNDVLNLFENLPGLMISEATTLQSKRDFSAASKVLSEAIELQPTNAKALYEYALCSAKMGRFTQSLLALARSAEVNPSEGSQCYSAVLQVAAVMNLPKAFSDLERLHQDFPKAAPVLFLRGFLGMTSQLNNDPRSQPLQNYENSMNDLNRALETQPNYALAQFCRAWLNILVSNADQAERDLRQVEASMQSSIELPFMWLRCYALQATQARDGESRAIAEQAAIQCLRTIAIENPKALERLDREAVFHSLRSHPEVLSIRASLR